MKRIPIILVVLLTLVWLAGCSAVSEKGLVEDKAGAETEEAVAETVSNSTTVPTETTDASEQTEPQASTTLPQEADTEEEKSLCSAVSSSSVTIASSTAAKTSKTISREEAKRIALERFGVAEKDISRYEIELDYDDDARRWEYEIGFYVGSTEYDVEIHAEDGTVLWEEKKTERETVTTTASKATISKAEAKSIALKHVGVKEEDISRYEIELDYDDDARRWEYEIGFYVGSTEYDLEIHAEDGTVLWEEKKTERETVNTTAASKATISKAEAKSIALKHAGVKEEDISRYEIELDYDDDARRWEYEISFNVDRVEYDITVDGTTGAVLEFEKDTD